MTDIFEICNQILSSSIFFSVVLPNSLVGCIFLSDVSLKRGLALAQNHKRVEMLFGSRAFCYERYRTKHTYHQY